METILLINVFLLLIAGQTCLIYHDEIIVSNNDVENILDDDQYSFSPLVQCHFL